MKLDHHFIYSLKHNQSMSWNVALTELIDNAIDAKATQIVAGWKAKKFSLHDDGLGVDPDGFNALYTLGGHVKTPNRQTIGRFGIGFKEAAGWLWGRTTITSFNRGISRRLIIDWEKEANRGVVHDKEAPVKLLKGGDTVFHTKIECERIQKTMPSPEAFDRLVAHLEHTYRPALESGLQVGLTRGDDAPRTLKPAPWPLPTADVLQIDTTITVAGRQVSLRAYLAADDVMFPGIHFAAMGRAMDRFVPVESNRLYGWVHLGPEWEVSKNKTQISDRLRPDLMKAIEEVCAPLIAAAKKYHQAAVIQDLKLLFNPYLDGLAATCLVPKRKPSEEPGDRHRGNGSSTGDHGRNSRDDADDPNAPPEQKTSRAPKIMLDFTKSPTGQVVWLEIHNNTWTVKANADHLLEDFVTEKVFGGRGSDPSRLMNVVITTIAATAVWNDEVAQAMSWLDNVPQSQRYGLAMDRLWKTYLMMRQKSPMVEDMYDVETLAPRDEPPHA